MNRRFVAQIFNLPYRRLAVGWAPELPEGLELAEAPQIPILRYGRAQLCATPGSRQFMFQMHDSKSLGSAQE